MIPAAEAGRNASISFAPELLALSADGSGQRQACVGRWAWRRRRHALRSAV